MYDIIWNSIIPWNTLCRLMLVLSYWTLCLATGLFTNIQNMLELARCVKLHWSKRGVERNVSTSDSCQLEACGGARTHGWPWIPGKTWEEQNQLSLEMTCTFLMMCFQNLPLVFKQSVCECVCLGSSSLFKKKLLIRKLLPGSNDLEHLPGVPLRYPGWDEGGSYTRTGDVTTKTQTTIASPAWPMATDGQELLGLVQLSMLGFSGYEKSWNICIFWFRTTSLSGWNPANDLDILWDYINHIIYTSIGVGYDNGMTSKMATFCEAWIGE